MNRCAGLSRSIADRGLAIIPYVAFFRLVPEYGTGPRRRPIRPKSDPSVGQGRTTKADLRRLPRRVAHTDTEMCPGR